MLVINVPLLDLVNPTMRKEAAINDLIKNLNAETDLISDGYHTFAELYEHRICLFMALCRVTFQNCNVSVWKSKKHSDGVAWEGWFILGMNEAEGQQITYHLPVIYWNFCDFPELECAPPYDGHSPNDVIKRINSFYI